MRQSKFLCILTLFIPLVAGLSRSRSQFQQWFPTPQTFSNNTFHKKCEPQYTNYTNESLEDPGPGHQWSTELVACILENYGEANKANMAVTAILLALLPAGLVQFGPSMAEISLLSRRRPILAMLLGFGLMSPNPNEFEYHEILEKAVNEGDSILRLGPLDNSIWGKIILSFIEYIIGIAVTGNLFYQMYRFTYQAIPLAPVVAYVPGVPEAATLFGWASLNLPIYLVSFAVAAMTVSLNPLPNKGNFIVDELTPCGLGQEIEIENKHERDPETPNVPSKWKLPAQTLGSFIRLIGGLHIILGTVLIGSILLIPLGDSLPVIYSFVFAALTTRIVLSIEMNGLARKISNLNIYLDKQANLDRPAPPKNTEKGDPVERQGLMTNQKGYDSNLAA